MITSPKNFSSTGWDEMFFLLLWVVDPKITKEAHQKVKNFNVLLSKFKTLMNIKIGEYRDYSPVQPTRNVGNLQLPKCHSGLWAFLCAQDHRDATPGYVLATNDLSQF